MSPTAFATDFCKIDLDQYVSYTHDPRNEYSQLYGVEHLGNVWKGSDVRYLNVPMERIKELVQKSVDVNEPVWFGSDVGQYFHRKTSVLDKNRFAYMDYLDIPNTHTKKDRIDTGQSLMTHAMVFSGYHVDRYGKVDWYEIENSWGTDGPYKGFLACTDEWFGEYVYQLVTKRKLATEAEMETWNGKVAKNHPLWDPMGALATNN